MDHFCFILKINGPFPSSPGHLYQNEFKCSAFDMQMIFHSHANKTHLERSCTWPHFESESLELGSGLYTLNTHFNHFI